MHEHLCATAGNVSAAPVYWCDKEQASLYLAHAEPAATRLAVFKYAVTGSSFLASLLAAHRGVRTYFEPFGTAATLRCKAAEEERMLRTLFRDSTCRFVPGFDGMRGGTCACNFRCDTRVPFRAGSASAVDNLPPWPGGQWPLTAVLFNPTLEKLTEGNESFGIRKGDPDAMNVFSNWIMVNTSNGWLQERWTYWFATMDWSDQVDLK